MATKAMGLTQINLEVVGFKILNWYILHIATKEKKKCCNLTDHTNGRVCGNMQA